MRPRPVGPSIRGLGSEMCPVAAGASAHRPGRAGFLTRKRRKCLPSCDPLKVGRFGNRRPGRLLSRNHAIETQVVAPWIFAQGEECGAWHILYGSGSASRRSPCAKRPSKRCVSIAWLRLSPGQRAGWSFRIIAAGHRPAINQPPAPATWLKSPVTIPQRA